MGWFGSACSAVGSFVSSVGSAISSAASSIGGALANVANKFVELAGPKIEIIALIIEAVGAILGVLKPEEKVEDLGDRAVRSDKTPEDFDTTQEYMDYLREEVPFDKDEFDKLSKEEKLARSAIGSSIAMKAINDKKGFEVTPQTWLTLAKLHQSGGLKDAKAEEFDTILNNFKDNQKDLENYVKGELEPIKEIEVGDKLVEMYQDLEPNLSKDDINEKVMKMEIGE